MAEKIATYIARDLKLNPTNAGYEATQQAGRRLGPLADQAASAVKEVASLNAKVIEEFGRQQTAFARFEGLDAEQNKNRASGGFSVRYGGGLKDMFQLGNGGGSPRLGELQNGALRLAQAARQTVHAQSPLTHDLSPGEAWFKNQIGEGITDTQRQRLNDYMAQHSKEIIRGIETNPQRGGVAPIPDVTSGQEQKDFKADQQDTTMDNYLKKNYGYNVDDRGSGQDTTPDLTAAGYNRTEPVPHTSTGGYAGFGGDEPPPQSSGSGFLNAIATVGGLWPMSNGQAPAGQPRAEAPILPDTNSNAWPTVPGQQPDQPPTPAAAPDAPPLWNDLQTGW